MKTAHRITALIATTLALSASLPALAETEADMSFDGMVAMKRMDKNKDGMVSKQEYLETMAKVWDMKAKKMNVKGDRMSLEDFKEILMYLKAGG
jgi:hypothetical protein